MESVVTDNGNVLFAFGINHRTAPVEIREKLYIHDGEMPVLLKHFRESMAECVVLSTCNRTEVYGVASAVALDINAFIDQLIEFKNAGEIVERKHFFKAVSCRASIQLFNVAVGVDSQVLGDSQILKQFKNAYFLAKGNDATGRILNQISQRALKLAKRTYGETDVHKGAVSISLAAVELVAASLGSIREKTAMIVGAGETAKLVAEAMIARRAAKIMVANRTRQNAEEFAFSLSRSGNTEIEVIEMAELADHLDEADILISSTGSHIPVINSSDVGERKKPIFMIDIAVPRDISPDVALVNGVTLKNIDDLNATIDDNSERRRTSLPNVQKIITKEMTEFLTWYYTLPLAPETTKTRTKPSREVSDKFLAIKDLLRANLSEIHKAARAEIGDDKYDLEVHQKLVNQLKDLNLNKGKQINA